MIVAVLTDLHSNDTAFRRCVDHARHSGAEAFCFLGDYLGDLAGVRETLDLLGQVMADYPCTLLRGNKEDYWLGPDEKRQSWRYGNSATGALLYTYQLLTEEDKALFASLPIARRVEYPGLPPIMLCHGSPDSNRGVLGDNAETRAMMTASVEKLIICGHTHKPFVLEHADATLINPGAVGVALGSSSTAHYLLLRGEKGCWQYELVALDYDAEAAIQKLYDTRQHELAPAWTRTTIQILRHGAPPKTQSLKRAMDICRERFGECVWPEIPEACWNQALEEMGVE